MDSVWFTLLGALIQPLRAKKSIPEWVTLLLQFGLGAACAAGAVGFDFHKLTAESLGLYIGSAIGSTQLASSLSNAGLLNSNLKTNSQN